MLKNHLLKFVIHSCFNISLQNKKDKTIWSKHIMSNDEKVLETNSGDKLHNNVYVFKATKLYTEK